MLQQPESCKIDFSNIVLSQF